MPANETEMLAALGAAAARSRREIIRVPAVIEPWRGSECAMWQNAARVPQPKRRVRSKQHTPSTPKR